MNVAGTQVGSRLARRSAILPCLLASVLLVACGTSSSYRYSSIETHIVRSGETLAGIAARYGRDHRDLARWNKLGDGSLIYPGQRIHLNPSAASNAAAQHQRSGSGPAGKTNNARPDAPSPQWGWPTNGQIIAGFDSKPGSGSGLLISGKAGQPVRAAAGGRVVYSGGGLIGYGQLIIVKHNDTYLSAYGHNASVLVKEGEQIKKGQRIATMGEGPGLEPRLHFEIRRNGEPVDPRRYLPAR